MSRFQSLALLSLTICALTAASGCRNRCGNQCSNGLFAGSPTIAPPATYSLNIPSVASNQPYYVPGQTPVIPNFGGVSSTLNPNASAPAAAGTQTAAQPTSAQLNGWRPTNENPAGATANPNSGQSTTGGSTTFAQNGSGIPPGYRTASSTALPGSGSSYTDSRNYQSTRVDETRDSTRLPATDASTVRAPAQNFPTGDATRLAQLQPPTPPNYPNTFNSPASTGQPLNQPVYRNQAGNLVTANGQPVYIGTPIVTGNAGYSGGYQTSPVYVGQPFTSSAPSVLAQSTTNYDATTNGNQYGWRDRDLGSDSFR